MDGALSLPSDVLFGVLTGVVSSIVDVLAGSHTGEVEGVFAFRLLLRRSGRIRAMRHTTITIRYLIRFFLLCSMLHVLSSCDYRNNRNRTSIRRTLKMVVSRSGIMMIE